MAKETPSRRQQQMRERISQLAARLIAEDGIQDYGMAKRKAARQLGAPDSHSLPGNGEVEQALRDYQSLYQKEEHEVRLQLLREQALQFMRIFERFNPYLTGSVLNGAATRHSDINLQLFTDSAKEVELFLLNNQMPYKAGEKRLRVGDEQRVVPTFALPGAQAMVDIAVFSPEDLRAAPRSSAEGKSSDRATLKQVLALINPMGSFSEQDHFAIKV